jgi:hypothetical protein
MFKTIKRIASRIQSLFKKKRTYQNILFSLLSSQDQALAAQIRAKRITYLSTERLASIAIACRFVESQNIPGIIIEAGCALGGSSTLIASIKSNDRELRVYDVFGMIPSPSKQDMGDAHRRYKIISEGRSKGIMGNKYYGYEENLIGKIESNFASFGIDLKTHNVHLIKGLLQDTLNVNGPVALAHIDVDWYDPVYTCLERIMPKLVIGGMIIIDDYYDWKSCRKAVDEFLPSLQGKISIDSTAGSLKITRIA